MGARTCKQLGDNLGALDVTRSDEHRARLEQASLIELGVPHDFLRRPMTVQAITDGAPLPARTW